MSTSGESCCPLSPELSRTPDRTIGLALRSNGGIEVNIELID